MFWATCGPRAWVFFHLWAKLSPRAVAVEPFRDGPVAGLGVEQTGCEVHPADGEVGGVWGLAQIIQEFCVSRETDKRWMKTSEKFFSEPPSADSEALWAE